MEDYANIARVQGFKTPHTLFSFDYHHITTCPADYLIPIFTLDCVPSDIIKLNANAFIRFTDLKRPFLTPLHCEIFYFFVPYRLLWKHFVNMMGERSRRDKDNIMSYVVPKIELNKDNCKSQTLFNYLFGINTDNWTAEQKVKVEAFKARAYNMIYNEWFRPEFIIDQIPEADGDNEEDEDGNVVNYTLLRRSKRPDYFTNCLPYPQFGPDVLIPTSGQASITYPAGSIPDVPFSAKVNSSQVAVAADDVSLLRAFKSDGTLLNSNGDYPEVLGKPRNQSKVVAYQVTPDKLGSNSGDVYVAMTADGAIQGTYLDRLIQGLRVNLSDAQAATINQLRYAFAVQYIFEMDMRGGVRFTEMVQNYYGVVNPDSRLQRPEFLGSDSAVFNLFEIPQTSAGTSTSPQGNLAAQGKLLMPSGYLRYSVVENGLIMGIMNIRAEKLYQQGVSRLDTRTSRFDFHNPAFNHLGEQPVYSKELYCDGSSDDDEVFGYQERYAEYKTKFSNVTGYLNSESALPIDYWHLGQDFSERPTLNEDFINENTPLDRVRELTSENVNAPFIVDYYAKIKAIRPISKYSTPSNLTYGSMRM